MPSQHPTLDQDEQQGFGPETITLKNVSRNVETILKTLQLNRIFNLEFNTGRFDVLE